MLLQLGPSSPAELPAQDPAAPTQSHCYDIFQMTHLLKNAPLACWNKLSTRFMGSFARRFQRQRIQTSWDTDIGNSHLYTCERGQMAARLPVRCSHLDPRKRYIPPLRLSRAHLASGPDVSILFSSLSCLRFAHSPAPPARPGGPVGHLPSSCHHTSCRARHRLHFCCRTCGRSWMPPQYRDKPPRPGDRRSGPTGSREREEEVGLHLERLVGDSKKTGKWNKGCDTPDAKREMRPEKKNRLLGRRE